MLRRLKGFTLIEVMIVAAVICFIATCSVLYFVGGSWKMVNSIKMEKDLRLLNFIWLAFGLATLGLGIDMFFIHTDKEIGSFALKAVAFTGFLVSTVIVAPYERYNIKRRYNS